MGKFLSKTDLFNKAVKRMSYTENGDIKCQVLFDNYEDFIPFLASKLDPESYGVDIFNRCVSGEFGKIKKYSPPPVDHTADADAKKSAILTDARRTINLWQTELHLGTISDEDKEKLIKWVSYIKAVESVDTSKAPDIEWPEVTMYLI